MYADSYLESRTLRTTLFGKIKLAQDIQDGTKVAVKKSNKEKLAKNQECGRVSEDPRTEISIMSLLKEAGGSPYVVNMIDWYEDKENVINVMELVPGGELYDYIVNNEKASYKTHLRYMLQLARGVQFLHSNKVAHLDISLENVVLSEDYGIAKLCDFGVARILNNFDESFDKSETGMRPGKMGYMAPEIFNRHIGSYRPMAADIFSLGVTFFILVTGVPPIAHDRSSDVCIRWIQKGKIEGVMKHFKLDVPQPILDVLTGMLAPEKYRWNIEQIVTMLAEFNRQTGLVLDDISYINSELSPKSQCTNDSTPVSPRAMELDDEKCFQP